MTAIEDLYVSAANRFLHSVVVVDDRARLTPEDDDADEVEADLEDPSPFAGLPLSGTKPPELGSGANEGSDAAPRPDSGPSSQDAPDPEDPPPDPEDGTADENRLDAGLLIETFARLGMVCSAIRPEGAASDVERLVARAASRCDIVTVDWHLATPDDHGAKALAVVNELSSEQDDGRLRLLAVYTGDPRGDQIEAALIGLSRTARLGPLLFQRNSTRIVILFKENTRLPAHSTGEIVTVVDLPQRLIREFARLCEGIVPATAMTALGAVRGNLHEILSVLHGGHDRAFLGHRLAQDNPDDATEHLIELIVSEVRSVIDEDAETARVAGHEALMLWLQDREESELAVSTQTIETLSLRGGSKIVRNELGNSDADYLPKKKWHPTALLASGDRLQADDLNARLAERMTVRHLYMRSSPRRLELGVLIADADRHYWVCIQPLCDSVRLEKATARVPLLPCRASEDKAKFDLVLSADDEILQLALRPHPSEIEVVEFAVTPTTKDVGATFVEGEWRFTSKSRGAYMYVSQLKPDQAQRIVQDLGTTASRVGLNESEWLRRKTRGEPT